MRRHFSVLSYFIPFAKNKIWHFSIPLIFALFMALQESLVPYCLKLIIDGIHHHFQNDIRIWTLLFWPVVSYLCITELTNIVFRLRDYFKMAVFPQLKGDVVMHTYHYLLRHSYSFFQEHYTGSLISKTSDLMRGIESVFSMIIDLFLWRLLSLIIATIALYFTHPLFSLFVMTWTISFVLTTFKLSKKSSLLSQTFSESRSYLFGALSDSLSNIFNIILFHNLKYEKNTIDIILKNHQVNEKRMLKKGLIIGVIQGLFVTGFTAAMVVGLVYAAENHYITLGDFAFVITLSGTIIRNVYSVSSDMITFSKEIGICKQALSLYQTKPAITDQPNAQVLERVKGHITFKKVYFTYPNGASVFNNFTLNIQAGEKVGIVGASGVGKTTMINLLLRFYDVDQGRIFLDGHDIQYATLESLRSQYAVIPQEPLLFNRTIYDNILFGRLDATEQEIEQVIHLAQLDDFIQDLICGLSTLVGERGIKLSGGQKQRLVIARALLKNAPIIIMDEPTSALDANTEGSLFKATHNLLKGRTALIIAHRLGTLKTLDKIIVLDNHGILETGNHEELLSNKGAYANLWQMQYKSTIEIL